MTRKRQRAIKQLEYRVRLLESYERLSQLREQSSYRMSKAVEAHMDRLQAIADAALILMMKEDGSLVGHGYVSGPGNMEMVLTSSVNNVLALKQALEANMEAGQKNIEDIDA